MGNPGGVRGFSFVAKPAKPYRIVGNPARRPAGVDQVQLERRRQGESVGHELRGHEILLIWFGSLCNRQTFHTPHDCH